MKQTTKLTIIILLSFKSIVNAFCFDEKAGEFNVNPSLLRSIAETESNLNPNAINMNRDGSVDIGLMQINSSWIRPMGLDRQRLVSDPCYNVSTGARILQMCMEKHGYTWEAVGCYNATSKGKRRKYSWKVYNQLKKYGMVQKSAHKQSVPEQTTSTLSFSVTDKKDGG